MGGYRPHSLKALEAYPCPICGAKDYRWGVPKGYSRTTFISDEAGALKRLLGSGNLLIARKCNQCGNVYLFDR